MYISRITYMNGEASDSYFSEESEALDHLLSFQRRQSDDIKNVSILNGQNYVLHILPFQGTKAQSVISAGNYVKLKKEYSSPEEIERNDVFVVTNMNDWSGQINNTCLTIDMVLKPTETVGVEMVHPISAKGVYVI